MLTALLRAASEDQARKASIPALADEMLREAADRYGACRRHCPFDPGALVTPRKDSMYQGKGDPHFIIEIRNRPEPNFGVGSSSTPVYGNTADMRVLCYSDGGIVPYWVESWQFEPWEPAKPQPADQ